MNSLSMVEDWFHRFNEGASTETLFTRDALWRDYLAFDWDLRTHEGSQLDGGRRFEQLSGFQPLTDNETSFHFRSSNGICRGLIELDNGRASRIFTQLQTPARTPVSAEEIQVLIIGAGQSGLALAAQLQKLSVKSLILEQNPRVGDNWRNRYDSLKLHDPVWVNHLPFRPFPDDWPTFTPKDAMGDWLEAYAEDLGLMVRTNTRVVKASFGDSWTVETECGGAREQLTAPHLVFAVGTSGFPRVPQFEGREDFAGPQLHSSAYVNGRDFAGKQVAIIGANNSAHDIAVDLYNAGAMPTLIQRSSTHVVPHQIYLDRILAPVWSPENGRPVEDADFLSLAQPMRRLEARGQALFAQVQTDWADYYEALAASGFALDFADDGSGIIGKYRRTASGYYIDVGGSALVAEGRIGLHSGSPVERLLADRVRMQDGTEIQADAIIYATGFGAMEQWVERLIDPETARKIGPCWGYGSGFAGDPGPWEGELRNMWKPTAQQGLWFMGGNLAQVRAFSRLLALQLANACAS